MSLFFDAKKDMAHLRRVAALKPGDKVAVFGACRNDHRNITFGEVARTTKAFLWVRSNFEGLILTSRFTKSTAVEYGYANELWFNKPYVDADMPSYRQAAKKSK